MAHIKFSKECTMESVLTEAAAHKWNNQAVNTIITNAIDGREAFTSDDKTSRIKFELSDGFLYKLEIKRTEHAWELTVSRLMPFDIPDEAFNLDTSRQLPFGEYDIYRPTK